MVWILYITDQPLYVLNRILYVGKNFLSVSDQTLYATNEVQYVSDESLYIPWLSHKNYFILQWTYCTSMRTYLKLVMINVGSISTPVYPADWLDGHSCHGISVSSASKPSHAMLKRHTIMLLSSCVLHVQSIIPYGVESLSDVSKLPVSAAPRYAQWTRCHVHVHGMYHTIWISDRTIYHSLHTLTNCMSWLFLFNVRMVMDVTVVHVSFITLSHCMTRCTYRRSMYYTFRLTHRTMNCRTVMLLYSHKLHVAAVYSYAWV